VRAGELNGILPRLEEKVERVIEQLDGRRAGGFRVRRQRNGLATRTPLKSIPS